MSEIEKAAKAAGMEFITDSDGWVCIRPMLFDSNGRRLVRYQPDPCEFHADEHAAWRAALNKEIG